MWQKLHDTQKLSTNRSASVLEPAEENVEALKHILERVERTIEQRKVLLDWIEQWRQVMDSAHPIPPHKANNNEQTVLSKPGPRASAHGGRRRGPKATSTSAVLGPAKVMKAQPKKRKALIRKPRQPEVEAAMEHLDATPQAPPMHQETTPRLSKKDETLLRPLGRHKLSKAMRLANGNAKPLSRTHRCSTERPRTLSKRRLAPRRPQPAPQTITTRSGRISKPPMR